MFESNFCLISAIVIQTLHSKVKIIILLHKIVCISLAKLSKLTSKMQMSFVNESPGG
jgi:hypothetical protein